MLAALCLHLLDEQKQSWPQLAQAHLALSTVQTRSVSASGCQVFLQYNPQRAVSSGAAVDDESISKRPCFLCTGNLPARQKAILYQNNYLILCNPAPVFPEHFTIAHKRHLPQAIAASFSALLDLTYDLAPEFAVFYNGPACGASAPDHLHFQAAPRNLLPMIKDYPTQFRLVKETGGASFSIGKNLNCPVFMLEGGNKNIVQKQFSRLLKIIHQAAPGAAEPMINVICTYGKPVWRLIIFPRRRHRPDAYFREEGKRIFVSPGAIDLAGIIITPRLADFQRLDAAQIAGIYQEVLLTGNTINKIIAEI